MNAHIYHNPRAWNQGKLIGCLMSPSNAESGPQQKVPTSPLLRRCRTRLRVRA